MVRDGRQCPHRPRTHVTKLIVFTDLHMLDEGGRIIGLDPYERLANGIRHVNAHHADAARVIFMGDLAHDAATYRRLRGLLDELQPPHALMIGNHDDRAAFRDVHPEAAVDEHGFVQSVIDIDRRYRLVLLDTVDDRPLEWGSAHSGYLCRRRLAWLARQLSSAGSRKVLVFMHHPPCAVGFPGMDAIRLANAASFYRVLEKAGNVHHIFAGHIHRTIAGSHRGIPFSIFKSPVHQQPLDLASASDGLSVDEPAAYGIVLLGPASIVVHTEDYELAMARETCAPTVEA